MELSLENNTIKEIHSWSNNEMLTSQLVKNKQKTKRFLKIIKELPIPQLVIINRRILILSHKLH